jgi:hypothetical protein
MGFWIMELWKLVSWEGGWKFFNWGMLLTFPFFFFPLGMEETMGGSKEMKEQ